MFADIRILSGEVDSNVAYELLFRAAATVQVVMVRRNWRVGLLREFLPRSTKLLGLNINGGQVICVRLRKKRTGVSRSRARTRLVAGSGDKRPVSSPRVRCLADIPGTSASNFFAYEQVLGTLLHELVHIEIGEHNRAFHAMLDTLWREVEGLTSGALPRNLPALPSLVQNGHRLGKTTGTNTTTYVDQRLAEERDRKRHLLASVAMRRLDQLRGTSIQRQENKGPRGQLELGCIEPASKREPCKDDVEIIQDDLAISCTRESPLNIPFHGSGEQQCCRVIHVIDLTVPDSENEFDLIDLCANADDTS